MSFIHVILVKYKLTYLACASACRKFLVMSLPHRTGANSPKRVSSVHIGPFVLCLFFSVTVTGLVFAAVEKERILRAVSLSMWLDTLDFPEVAEAITALWRIHHDAALA